MRSGVKVSCSLNPNFIFGSAAGAGVVDMAGASVALSCCPVVPIPAWEVAVPRRML